MVCSWWNGNRYSLHSYSRIIYWKFSIERRKEMSGAILFLLGFASVTGVYEIAKTSKKSNTNKIERTINNIKKINK